MQNNYVASTSPHISSSVTTKRIMLDVVIALLPCFIAGIIFFGVKTLLVVGLAIISSVGSEVVFELLKKKPFKQAIDTDFTSLVTGFLIGLSLNVNSAWYIPVFASIFAIIVVKMLFGGTGKNIVNPAIAGRCFVFISFLGSATSNMATNWPTSGGLTTGATPLTNMLVDGVNAVNLSNLDLLLGNGLTGCIGETCKIAIIVGFIYLVVRKVIDFKWPLIFVATAGLFTVVLKGFDFSYFLTTILSGALMFVGVFMATDYVTTPNTKVGKLIYFVCLGILTAILRVACKMEVVTFTILLMNFTVPLIDKWIIPKPYGVPKATKKAKEIA